MVWGVGFVWGGGSGVGVSGMGGACLERSTSPLLVMSYISIKAIKTEAKGQQPCNNSIALSPGTLTQVSEGPHRAAATAPCRRVGKPTDLELDAQVDGHHEPKTPRKWWFSAFWPQGIGCQSRSPKTENIWASCNPYTRSRSLHETLSPDSMSR